MAADESIQTQNRQDFPIAIIGAGFAGIGTAIRLATTRSTRASRRSTRPARDPSDYELAPFQDS